MPYGGPIVEMDALIGVKCIPLFGLLPDSASNHSLMLQTFHTLGRTRVIMQRKYTMGHKLEAPK